LVYGKLSEVTAAMRAEKMRLSTVAGIKAIALRNDR
jgi:hypothetical protein